jgi:hypothetical protein
MSEELRLIVARKVRGCNDKAVFSHVFFKAASVAPDVSLQELVAAIQVQCIDALLGDLELRWQENYQKTLRRYEETGNCYEPHDGDVQLHNWQSSQRQRYNSSKCKMDPDRIKLLNKIPGWTWNIIEAAWQEGYQKTLSRHEETGNCQPKDGDTPLRRWQATQRREYKKGELFPNRVKLLNEIPSWSWKPLESAWQENYQKTLRRHQETGDCREPFTGGDADLYSWQMTQRATYQQGKLSPDRTKLLNEIPSWIWDAGKDWQEGYQRTLRRHEETGNCHDPRDRWQLIQKNLYNKGELSPDRVKLLNEIPSWSWNKTEAAWQKNYQRTLRRHEETGDCYEPHDGDFPFHNWQLTQRQRYKQGKLCPKRIKLLSEIPSWIWSALEAAWQEGYQKTLRRHEETGDCYESSSGDIKLWNWQRAQRDNYNSGTLSPDRIKLLNDIPSWRWEATIYQTTSPGNQKRPPLQKAA